LDQLRRTGIEADTDVRSLTLKSHLRQADRLGATYAAILGDDEASNGIVLLRDMTTKTQEQLSITALPQLLAERICPTSQ
jgi:histidyl-tRNA synthetase